MYYYVLLRHISQVIFYIVIEITLELTRGNAQRFNVGFNDLIELPDLISYNNVCRIRPKCPPINSPEYERS